MRAVRVGLRRRRRRAPRGVRHRDRHRARAAGRAVRAVHAGRRVHHAPLRRHRASGSRSRAARRAAGRRAHRASSIPGEGSTFGFTRAGRRRRAPARRARAAGRSPTARRVLSPTPTRAAAPRCAPSCPRAGRAATRRRHARGGARGGRLRPARDRRRPSGRGRACPPPTSRLLALTDRGGRRAPFEADAAVPSRSAAPPARGRSPTCCRPRHRAAAAPRPRGARAGARAPCSSPRTTRSTSS